MSSRGTDKLRRWLGVFSVVVLFAGSVQAEPLARTFNLRMSAQDSQRDAGNPLPVWIDISLRENILRIHWGDVVTDELPIATGSSSTPTPTGTFRVLDMQAEPIWQNPFYPEVTYRGGDRRNPLGARWIEFKQAGVNAYGIHGTSDPTSIGRAVTNGCIRLHNDDVAYLFEQVEEGTPIVIH